MQARLEANAEKLPMQTIIILKITDSYIILQIYPLQEEFNNRVPEANSTM